VGWQSSLAGARLVWRGLVATAAAIIFTGSMIAPGFAEHVEANDFAPEQEQPLSPQRADPQPKDGELSDGLAASYWKIYVRDIKEIADFVGRRKAKAGPPIAKLDYQVGQGNALTSGLSDGVGAEIKGYIKLDKPGIYRFLANSNDGIRIKLDDALLLEDPDVHGDQMTNWAEVNITEPGWYDFYLLYFERKGTSTLQFFWKAPDADDYDIVPETAFAH
jgi:hypothetical protein